MKFLRLLPLLCLVAHAQVVVFTFTGTTNYITSNPAFTMGDTMSAQFTVDLSTADTNASPSVGNYPSTGSAFVQFSNGLSFSNVPFTYKVVNDFTPQFMTLPYDAIAIYVTQPTFELGFELRFSTTTFANDYAIAPTQVALIPTGSAEIPNPTDWYYYDQSVAGFHYAGGPISSFSVQAVPEPATYAPALGAVVLLIAGVWRKRTLLVRDRSAQRDHGLELGD